MGFEKLWNKIMNELASGSIELHTVPSNRRTPLWFVASRDNDTVMISKAEKHNPSVKVSAQRMIRKKEFLTVASYYERWNAGERDLRQEVRLLSRNTAYIFGLITAFKE